MSKEKIQKLLEPRSVIYKRVKILMPHCSVCKKQLQGNDSGAMPYKCSCGIWENDWFKNPTEFRIKIKAL